MLVSWYDDNSRHLEYFESLSGCNLCPEQPLSRVSAKSNELCIFAKTSSYLCPNSEKGQIIGWVKLLEHGLGLVHQVVEEAAVLDGGGVIKSGFNGHSVCVHHNGSDDSLVSNQPLECLLYL